MPLRPRTLLALLATGVLLLGGCADDLETLPQTSPADAGSDAAAGAGPEAGPLPSACGPGALALGDGGCQPAGIPAEACGEGFVPTDAGSCEPILPAEPCTPGQMAIPGETACREVAPCGAGTWGDIPLEPTTQYVDGAYTGGNSDGSAARPWTTIQPAVDAAAPGAIVALGAGSYVGNVWIVDHPVRLWGKCPAEVELSGSNGNVPTIFVSGCDGAEVHDLAATGPSNAISVHGAKNVRIDRVWLHDLPEGGLDAVDLGQGCVVELSRSLVERVGWVAVEAMWGAELTVDQSTVRDSPPVGDDAPGWGLGAEWDTGGTGSRLTVRRSLVERNQDSGIQVFSSDLTVEDSVVRDTLATPAADSYGAGIAAKPDDGDTLVRTLDIRRSVVAGNRSCGVCAANVDAVIEATVVRDTLPTLLDQGQGFGLALIGELPSPSPRPVVAVRASVVERSFLFGIALAGVEATIDGTIVRDTESDSAQGLSGRGLAVEANGTTGVRTDLALTGSLVERSHEVGVAVLGSVATIAATVVQDTRPRPADGRLGRGVVAQLQLDSGDRAEVTVRGSLISASTEVGVYAGGADVLLEDTVVQGTLAQPEGGLFGDGVIASAVDGPNGPSASSVELHRCRVATNARVGLASFGSSLGIDLTQSECNAIDLDAEAYLNLPYALHDLGGNVCGCQGETATCQLTSAGLAPPEPL